MKELKHLSDLGPRICILGPSNSGKSTLAQAISHKLDYPLIHLDQLHHIPDTLWQARPKEEFLKLHDQVIQNDTWVIDGNYGQCLESRLHRATGLILLDISLIYMLKRYFYRTLFQKNRIGGVVNNQKDTISKEMLKYLILQTPKQRVRNQNIFNRCALNKIVLSSQLEVDKYWKKWGL